jgi:hypothetical protein
VDATKKRSVIEETNKVKRWIYFVKQKFSDVLPQGLKPKIFNSDTAGINACSTP